MSRRLSEEDRRIPGGGSRLYGWEPARADDGDCAGCDRPFALGQRIYRFGGWRNFCQGCLDGEPPVHEAFAGGPDI